MDKRSEPPSSPAEGGEGPGAPPPAPEVTAIEAATVRRLVAHLQAHPEAANIDLMIVADFCRNCLAKWYQEEAQARGVAIDEASARALIHGMPYAEWKASQPPATPAQLAAYGSRQKARS
jgi:hypothetical protein